jgi:uncharacterized protein
MEIRMTGASGYLGKVITAELIRQGHHVEGISRELLYGNPGELGEAVKNKDVLINLAGAPVLQRWTLKNQKEIYNSRVLTAQNLVHAITKLPAGQRPQKVISASAIGIYDSGKLHSEESREFDTGFLGELVQDWEKAWQQLPEGVQLTIFRIALVLGRESSIIKKLLMPFKLGLGGKIGNGRQAFPFVHEADTAQAFLWAIETPDAGGVFNLAAPHQISNKDFTRELAQILHRPAFLTIPPFALKMLYGKASELLTRSPAVIPKNLLKKNFKFRYSTIGEALENILK